MSQRFDLPFSGATRAEHFVAQNREARIAINRAAQLPSVTGKQIRYLVDKTTTGAVRYAQVNDADEPVVHDGDGAIIPYIYLRKRAVREMFGTDEVPPELTIRLSLG